MKKISLLIFACILYFNSAQAQFTFGPMVGTGLNIAETDQSGFSAKANGSFIGGAFARISIKRVYIQPELYYSNKTANFSYPIAPGYDVDSKIKTGNVNVNALVGVKLLKLTGAFNVRLFAGPSTSLVVAKSATVNGVNFSDPSLNAASFNVQGGLGVDITKLTIDVRYEKGLTDLTDGAGDVKINTLMLVLGFKIL